MVMYMDLLFYAILIIVFWVIWKRSAKTKRANYKKYMSSAAWRKTRQEALKRAGYKCEVCGATKNLHVHHLTYKNFTHEQPEDLKVLCQYHHRAVHGRL